MCAQNTKTRFVFTPNRDENIFEGYTQVGITRMFDLHFNLTVFSSRRWMIIMRHILALGYAPWGQDTCTAHCRFFLWISSYTDRYLPNALYRLSHSLIRFSILAPPTTDAFHRTRQWFTVSLLKAEPYWKWMLLSPSHFEKRKRQRQALWVVVDIIVLNKTANKPSLIKSKVKFARNQNQKSIRK